MNKLHFFEGGGKSENCLLYLSRKRTDVISQISYQPAARALHGNMKCLLAVLMCLVLSVPSFAESTKSAFQRVNNGSWTAYNIGRDYLGSITHIATSSGTLVAEYSYDPWGRLRNPATQAIYTPGTEPTLFLGRGYTGHEHLTWFGLINMNARLYDPLLGRFLSPDPYVQAPDFTQNFNRYSYALNNPLRYSDPNGEFVFTTAITVGIALGCFFGSMTGSIIGMNHGATGMEMVGYMLGGAAIGGLAGLAGGATSSALAFISSSGFWGGALAGGASSAASCFVSGTGFSLLNGDTFPQALRNGLISSGIGFAAGGMIGGLTSGVSSVIHRGNFWTGKGMVFDYVESPDVIGVQDGIEYSQKNVETFSQKHFGDRPDWISLRADGSLPDDYYRSNGHVYNPNNEPVYGSCQKTGFRSYTTYIFESACSSKQQLYLTLGHEYYHAYLWQIGIPKSNHHSIISEWQLRQVLEWNYKIETNLSFFNINNNPLYLNYMGLNELIPIIPRWLNL